MEQQAEKSKLSKKQIAVRVVSVILVMVSFGYVGEQIVQGWGHFSEQTWNFSPGFLVLSFLLLLLNFVMVAWGWAVVFRDLGEPAGIVQTFAIIYTAQLGRYIPGKVWIFLGQAHVAGRLGFNRTSALATSILINLCGNLGAFVVFGVSVFGAGYPQWMAWLAFAAAIAGTVVLIVAPNRIEALLNRYRAKKGGESIRLSFGRSAVLKCVGIMALAWVVNCAAFAALVSSITPTDPGAWFELGLAYNVAYFFAFYMLIVPGGIGVREGAITALLKTTLGTTMAGTVALAQRFWILAAEIAAFGIAMLILWRGKGRKHKIHP